MKTIKIYTTTSSWLTSINPAVSDKDILNYFLNQWFNVGIYPVEKMEQCIKVEILNKYLAKFQGKLKGAIGINQSFSNIEVMGINEDSARLNLYDNYDHIASLHLTKI